MKSVIALILFSLLFACKGNEEKPKASDLKIKTGRTDCVTEIFRKDSILGEIRNHASENISLSETIKNYSNNVLSLDYSYCPKEFKLAFQNHIKAWQKIRKVTDKHLSLRGELHNIFSELEKSEDSTEFKSHLKEIWDTWKIVEENSKR